MVVLVCGARVWADVAMIRSFLDGVEHGALEPLTVIEGGAKGADRIAGQWAAAARKRGVGWVRFAADWKRYGKGAGPVRNQQMLDYVLAARDMQHDVLVAAFTDSLAGSGTEDMVKRARKAGVHVEVMSHD